MRTELGCVCVCLICPPHKYVYDTGISVYMCVYMDLCVHLHNVHVCVYI